MTSSAFGWGFGGVRAGASGLFVKGSTAMVKVATGRADGSSIIGRGGANEAAVTTTIDITTPAFARRLAALLSVHRSHTKASIRSLARRSNGVVTSKVLHEIEAGTYPLDSDLVSVVAALYGADLESILPERMIVAVTPDGTVTAGPVVQKFDPSDENALLVAYLRLVRSLRGEQKAESLVLRRDDVEVLAGYLHLPGTVVLERLLSLMGSTRAQRSAVMALFATGAMVVGLSTGAAAFTGDSGSSSAAAPSTTAAVVVVETAVPGTDADVIEVAVPGTTTDATDAADDVSVGGALVPIAVDDTGSGIPIADAAASTPSTSTASTTGGATGGSTSGGHHSSGTTTPADPASDVSTGDAVAPLPDGDPSSATSAPDPSDTSVTDELPIPLAGTVLPDLPPELGINDAPVPADAPIDPPAVVSGGDVVLPPGVPPIVTPTTTPPVDLGVDQVAVLEA